MIEYRFGLAPLNTRDAYAHNIARSFDWRSKPRLDVPDLPRPEHVVSQPCWATPTARPRCARTSTTCWTS